MTPRVQVPAPIGVLCGGPSAEREISRRSGQAVWRALQGLGYPVRLVELPPADCAGARGSASPGASRCAGPLRQAGIRTAFIALHGPFGEDGTVQALLESLGVIYTGSGVAASRLASDKGAAKQRLRERGVPVPRGDALAASPPAPLDGLGFPFVVKPARQGSSFGLTIVDRPEDWPAALAEAARYDTTILREEYLPGPELTVGVLDGAPLPVLQVVPHRRCYDYLAKYTPGLTEYLVPAPLPPAITEVVQTTAVRAHRALGCRGFSRVDLILTSDRGPIVLEVNTIPGLTTMSLLPKAAAAAGLSFPQLCERLLASATQPGEESHGST